MTRRPWCALWRFSAMRRIAESILAFLRAVVQPFLRKGSKGTGAAGVTLDTDLYMKGIEMFIREGKDVEMAPKGSSMLPFIKGGRDSVLITRPSERLEVGNIVLARIGERYIMHRIFAVEGGSLTLMGDGNINGTETCAVKDVIGQVVEVHKENGRVVKVGKGRLWRFLRPVRRFLLAFYKRVIL